MFYSLFYSSKKSLNKELKIFIYKFATNNNKSHKERGAVKLLSHVTLEINFNI